ncbi:MAG: hypothetical protein Q7R39_07295 [Dehalococcoidia bacterium]|nr:hypothetical protein [Dehalococcoidia bacterium]
MVQDTRAAKGAGGVRPLGLPQPIEVRANERGWPVAVKLNRRWVTVTVEDRWRIDDEWWREERVARLYFVLTAQDRPMATVYRELMKDKWFSQG